jgi:SulP family sulfate permease
VAVGVGVAIVLALRAVARTARLEQMPLEVGDHSAEEHALLSEHIVAYRLPLRWSPMDVYRLRS